MQRFVRVNVQLFIGVICKEICRGNIQRFTKGNLQIFVMISVEIERGRGGGLNTRVGRGVLRCVREGVQKMC